MVYAGECALGSGALGAELPERNEAPLISHSEDEPPPTAPTIDAPSWLRPGAPRREPGDGGDAEPISPEEAAEGTAERTAARAHDDVREGTPAGEHAGPADGAGAPGAPLRRIE